VFFDICHVFVAYWTLKASFAHCKSDFTDDSIFNIQLATAHRRSMAETLEVTDMIPNRYEPKRKFRWLLAIEGIDAFLAKTTARPQRTFEEITVDWINHKRYLAGKHSFSSLKVELYDPIAPSGAQQVEEWIRLNFESVSGRSGYADFYKRDIQLKLLDPLGTVVELWDLKGAWVKDANYNDLDYASSDACLVSLDVRFDNAVLQY